jgi:uncharacterized protein DUF1549/uncharacterized protein DUF1553/cytochrome c
VIRLIVTLGILGGGGPDAEQEGLEFFEKRIRPLLVERCYSCHSASAKKVRGGLRLDLREGWSEGGRSGAAVIPGDVEASRLIQAVRYTDSRLKMPPDRMLPREEVALLERWVRMGAPDPRSKGPEASGGEAAARSGRIENPSDPAAGRNHWAFQPLRDARPPQAGSDPWPRSAIDSFVLSRLKAANLRPAPDADRRTLARRTYLQLIGLPPTPQQMSEFLLDQGGDAFDRLVDRLLGSPQFGERWGRHWLDLARYADSNGLDENFLFREAWRYRNWVIEAVNADLPFDRFVLEQIAGDLLPHDSIEQRDRQRIAAGFLVVGPKVLLGNDPKKQRMEIADEQLDTIGRAILGLTLGCARCHDHKFDPIPTADYYAMAGILTSTQVMEQRYMLGEQRVMERLVGLGREGDRADGAYEAYWLERPRLVEREKNARSALTLLEKGDAAGLEALRKEHGDAIDGGAADAALAMEQRIAAQKSMVARLTATIATPPAIPARAMIPGDVVEPGDESIRLAGQFDRPGERVPRAFLRVFGDSGMVIPPKQSGRLELGRWLTDVDRGAGRLAARVLANRVWYHLIGRGLVRTVDNFGRTGEAPDDPDLLDHLARELIDSGWSIKSLVRTIVTSRTFAMQSRHDDRGNSIDPDNRLLWRAHRRRLDPESLRDAMLLAAGELDLLPLQSSVWYLGDQATAVGDNKVRRRTDFSCRSVYLPVIRNDLPELFEVFDFADPHRTTGMRPHTSVPTQSLYLLNAEPVMAAADAIARRVLSLTASAGKESRVDRLYELLLNASPDKEERADMLRSIEEMEARLRSAGDPEAPARAWSMACQALLASSRFQILE